ncbi:MAG: HD domain-containing protein [Spirochaetales bacterium]|nr:HD domain-containing protein [Spirochaetales bacterium]
MELDEIYGTIETLCSEHDKLYLLTESCHDGICEIQADGTFIRVNPAFCKIMNMGETDVKTRSIFDLLKSSRLKRDIGALFSGEKKEITESLELTVESKIKKYIDIRMIAVPSKENVHVLGIILDKTEVTLALKNRELYIKQLHNFIRDTKIETKETIYHLAKLAEVNDPYIGNHLKRLEQYTKILATAYLHEYGEKEGYVTEKYVEDLTMSSLLHDVGKIGVSGSILTKPGKLTEKEFSVIKQHTEIVAESLKSFKGRKELLSLVREIANAHHEKWDGSGYPLGLKKEKIPLSARIISICDVYDALRSLRPYKNPFSHELSCEVIEAEKGKSFDPRIVDLFVKNHLKFKEIFAKYKDNTQSTRLKL